MSAVPVQLDPVPTSTPPPPPPPPPTSSRLVTDFPTSSLKPVDRYGFPPATHIAASSTASPLPRDYRGPLLTSSGTRLWLRSTRLSSTTTRGDSFLGLLVPTWSPTSGSSDTSSTSTTLGRHKARWVIRGFTQRYNIDYDETFTPSSSLPPFRLSSGSLHLDSGPSTSWT